MSYTISEYSKKRAKEIGVEIKKSTNKRKKLDVFKDGKKAASIGAIGCNDYPTYMDMEKNGVIPKGTAKKRRALYKKRHQNHRNKKGTASYYADKILW